MSILLSASAYPARPADNAPAAEVAPAERGASWPAGCWAVHVVSPVFFLPDQDGRFVLHTDGHRVGGSVALMGRKLPVTDGRVEGRRLTFSVARDGKHLRVEGHRTETGMSGTMSGARKPLTWSGVPCR